jgi:hypothetical protein
MAVRVSALTSISSYWLLGIRESVLRMIMIPFYFPINGISLGE